MPGDKGNSDINPEEDPDQTQPLGHEMPQPDPVEVFKEMIGQPGAPPTPPGNGWQALSPEELDQLLPDYTVVQMLGRGGMGAVYKAIQNSLDRPVAIKVLPGEFCEDIEFEVRFRREAKAMARLNHPNIIQIHDFGQTTGHHFFFVMEFVEGADLLKMIRLGHVDQDSALKVVIQVCEALQYAHDQGYVHRDIKPANILLNNEGVVKVGDFGLAKIVDPEQGTDTDKLGLTMTGYSMGTPHYIAPEQMSGENVDHRADIYSLGVMFYEMLTGEIPRGAFDPPSGKIQVDVRIDDVVLKAMQEKPERRYQAAKEVETDVEIIRSNPRGQTMAFKEKKGAGNKAGKSQKGWVGALVSLLVIGLVVGGMVWKPWEKSEDKTILVNDNPEVSPKPRDQRSSRFPPVKPGRLRVAGVAKVGDKSIPVDMSPFEGLTDIVQIGGLPTGKIIAMRANGEIVSNDPNIYSQKKGVTRLSQKYSSRSNLSHVMVYLDQKGQVIPSHANGEIPIGKLPNLDQPVLHAATTSLHGIFILGNQIAVPWGRAYETGNLPLNQKRPWSIPDSQILNGVQQAVVSSGYSQSGENEALFASVLHTNGKVDAWNAEGPIPLPKELAADVIKLGVVSLGEGILLALKSDGSVYAYGFSVETNTYAKRFHRDGGVRDFIATGNSPPDVLYQIEDGTWAFADPTSPRPRSPEFEDVLKELRGLPGEAILDRFMGSHSDLGFFAWIEPVEEKADESITATPPTIQLPPALAEMKKHGGVLRAWGKTEKGLDLTTEKAAGASDLVAVYNAHSDWGSIRTDGTVLHSLERGEMITSLTKVSKVLEGYALQQDGTLVIPWSTEPYKDVQDFALGNQLLFTLFKDGRLKAEPESNRELSESQRSIVQAIDSMDRVRLLTNRPRAGDGAVVQENGKVISWFGIEVFEPKVNGNELVDIASGHVACFGLNSAGSVVTWSNSSKQDVGDFIEAMLNPRLPGKAVALRADSGIAAVQLEDGKWYAWGVKSRQDVVDAVNQLEPALDLRFVNGGKGFWWIEPTSDLDLKTSKPQIEIPPALTAMKQRGGRLKTWAESGVKTFDLTEAETLDNFVQVAITDPGTMEWGAVRVDGTFIGQGRSVGKLIHLVRVGTSTIEEALRDVPAEQLKDLAGRPNWGMALTKSGRLIPYGTHPGKESSKWPEVRDSIMEQDGIMAIAAANDAGMALKEDGGVVAWNLSRAGSGLATIPDEVRKVVAIACGNNNFLALTAEGEVINWDHAGNLRSVPAFSSRPVAVRAQVGSSTRLSAAQLEDGSWVGWSDRPENKELVRQINQIGPALDLEFLGVMGEGDGGHLLWIEPTESNSTNIPAFKIELPPALAAMKKRGGRLQSWAMPEATQPLIPISPYEGLSDLVSLSHLGGLRDTSKLALARAEGILLDTDQPEIDQKLKSEIVKIVDAYGGYFIIRSDGTLTHHFHDPRPVNEPFPEKIIDCDTAAFGAGFILPSGQVGFRGWNDEDERQFLKVAAKWQPVINQRNDNVAISLHPANLGAVVRKDGTVLFLNADGEAIEQPELKNIVAIDRDRHWLALQKDGTVLTGGRNIDGECNVPNDLGKAVAVRIWNHISLAQKEDGRWVAWGENENGLVDKINSLGPAIDLDIHSGLGHLYWIEPVKEGNSAEATFPEIKLPPTLAGLKKHGGRIKTWASPSATKAVPTLPGTEAIQNAVELDADTFGHWSARLNDGKVITSRDDFAFLNDITDAIAIRAGGPHMALESSGKLAESWSQSRDISFPDGIRNFDLCFGLGVFLLDTGEVVFRALNKPNSTERRRHEEISSKWSEVINQRSDNIAVAIDDAPSCAVLRSDGTILVGSPSGEIKQRDESEFRDIVEIDVTGGGWFLALKKGGTVLGLPRSISNSIPPDLGKAVAVEIERDVCAAQMEDGSWIAWGEGDADLIKKINSIGPAIDLKFSPENGHLFWIEPVTLTDSATPRVPENQIPPVRG